MDVAYRIIQEKYRVGDFFRFGTTSLVFQFDLHGCEHPNFQVLDCLNPTVCPFPTLASLYNPMGSYWFSRLWVQSGIKKTPCNEDDCYYTLQWLHIGPGWYEVPVKWTMTMTDYFQGCVDLPKIAGLPIREHVTNGLVW